MTFKILGDAPTGISAPTVDRVALILRVGLGSVFLVGGWWKLSRALDPERAGPLVEKYMASNGYINAFFEQYLFAAPDALITPLAFLMILSAFELLSGLALIAGFMVRGLSFIYAFLLWSFVIALPVMTVPGVTIDNASFFSPALLVQIRDVGLSGMFFMLLNSGSGSYSIDQTVLKRGAGPATLNWNTYGLLLRLSVAAVFLVGGFFAGLDHIKSFVPAPVLLIAVGLVLASGHAVRFAAAAGFAIIAWYSIGKLNMDASLWGNLNAIKREFAYLAATGILVVFEGGRAFRVGDILRAPFGSLFGSSKAA